MREKRIKTNLPGFLFGIFVKTLMRLVEHYEFVIDSLVAVIKKTVGYFLRFCFEEQVNHV